MAGVHAEVGESATVRRPGALRRVEDESLEPVAECRVGGELAEPHQAEGQLGERAVLVRSLRVRQAVQAFVADQGAARRRAGRDLPQRGPDSRPGIGGVEHERTQVLGRVHGMPAQGPVGIGEARASQVIVGKRGRPGVEIPEHGARGLAVARFAGTLLEHLQRVDEAQPVRDPRAIVRRRMSPEPGGRRCIGPQRSIDRATGRKQATGVACELVVAQQHEQCA